MSKLAIFLGPDNTRVLIKTLYQKHRKDGGTFHINTFNEQVPTLMANWKETHTLDTYESLVFDPVGEIEYINSCFVKTFWPMFSVGDDYKSIPKLQTPADYHNLDTSSPEDISVSSQVYRFDNNIPLYQKLPDRHYDRANEGSGLRGRSIEQDSYSVGDMDKLLNHVNKSYNKVDTNDVPYYGQLPDDSNDTLTSTLWASN